MKDNETMTPQDGEAAPHASEHRRRHAVRRLPVGDEVEAAAEHPAEAPSEAVTPSEEAPKASPKKEKTSAPSSKKTPEAPVKASAEETKPHASSRSSEAPAEELPSDGPALPAEPITEGAPPDGPLPPKAPTHKAKPAADRSLFPEEPVAAQPKSAAPTKEDRTPQKASAEPEDATDEMLSETEGKPLPAVGMVGKVLRASPVGAFLAKVNDKLPASAPKRVLSVAPSHTAASLRTVESVQSMRIDMLVALFPMVAFAVYLFGFRVLTLTAVSVLFCYLAEIVGRLLFHKRGSLDLEPAVLGVILVLGMPPTAPLWLPVLAAFLAVLPFRFLFDGKLRSWVNPVAAVLLLFYLIFPAVMKAFCAVGAELSAFGFTAGSYEAAEATILQAILKGTLPAESLGAAFVGLRPGLIGETSALLLLAAAVYLSARKLLRPAMPLFCLLTVGILTYFFPTLAAASDVIALRYAGYHLVGSELLFGLLFLASDPLTSPRSTRASIAAGIIGGLVTVGVRYWISPDLGVLVAVLVIGLLARPLDLLLCPPVFGGRRKKKA